MFSRLAEISKEIDNLFMKINSYKAELDSLMGLHQGCFVAIKRQSKAKESVGFVGHGSDGIYWIYPIEYRGFPKESLIQKKAMKIARVQYDFDSVRKIDEKEAEEMFVKIYKKSWSIKWLKLKKQDKLPLRDL